MLFNKLNLVLIFILILIFVNLSLFAKEKQDKYDHRIISMTENERYATAYVYMKYSAEYQKSERKFLGWNLIVSGATTFMMFNSLDSDDTGVGVFIGGLFAVPGIITLFIKSDVENAYEGIKDGKIDPVSGVGIWAAKEKTKRQLSGVMYIGLGLLYGIGMPSLINSYADDYYDDDEYEDIPAYPFQIEGGIIAAQGIYLLLNKKVPERIFDAIRPKDTASSVHITPTLSYDYKNKSGTLGVCINF